MSIQSSGLYRTHLVLSLVVTAIVLWNHALVLADTRGSEFSVATGITLPRSGDFSRDWNAGPGLSIKYGPRVGKHTAVILAADYSRLSLDKEAVAGNVYWASGSVEIGGGAINVLAVSVAVNHTLFPRQRAFKPYLTIGLGRYHEYQENSRVQYEDVVLVGESDSPLTGWMWIAGIGLQRRYGEKIALFAEARFLFADIGGSNTSELLPLTIGVTFLIGESYR